MDLIVPNLALPRAPSTPLGTELVAFDNALVRVLTPYFTTLALRVNASMLSNGATPMTGNLDLAGFDVLNVGKFAISGLGTGLVAHTGAGVYASRTLTGTAGEVTVTNGSGATSDPVISLPVALSFSGKSVSGGTFASGTFTSGTFTGGTYTTGTFSGVFNGSLGSSSPSTIAASTISATGLITATGGQIRFPTTQVPSTNANTLDDYEEGTFTPTMVGSTTAGTTTYVAQSGKYTKIGRLVSINGTIQWSAMTGTGNLTLGGLPFTIGSLSAPITALADNLTYTNQFAGIILITATAGGLPATQSSGGSFSYVAVDTAGRLYFAGTYEV